MVVTCGNLQKDKHGDHVDPQLGQPTGLETHPLIFCDFNRNIYFRQLRINHGSTITIYWIDVDHEIREICQ